MWYKKIDQQTVGICGFLLYVMLDQLALIFLPNEFIRYIFLGIMTAFAVLHRLSKIVTFQDICLLLAVPFLIFNNVALNHGLYSSIITYVLILIMFVFGKNSESWFLSVFKIIGFFAIFYALATLVLAMVPSFYEQNVIPLFSAADQISLKRTNEMGYFAGLTSHYSHNAMFMSLGVGLFGSMIICRQFKSNKRILMILGFILCAVVLLLTGKRGHVIFSGVALVVTYYIYNSDKKGRRLLKMLLVFGFLIAAIYILSNFFPSLLNFLRRFNETEEAGNIYSGRDKLIELAYELFQTSPVFGIGWYGFRYVHIQRMPWFTNMVHVHNVYMQLLCETGIVGFTIYMAFFVKNYYQCIRLSIAERKKKCIVPNEFSFILSFSVFMQTFFLLYCMTGNPLYDNIVFFPYILVSMMTIIITKNYGPSYLRKQKYVLRIG
ncbi:MAG: O-antigen ligase family protein [Ruminococcus sp.]|nr:O-antigen ligase family protein [Ruminococcus sp.]